MIDLEILADAGRPTPVGALDQRRRAGLRELRCAGLARR
jgi:hypothetical protein